MKNIVKNYLLNVKDSPMNYPYSDTPVDDVTEALVHHFPEVSDRNAVYLGFDCETTGLLPEPGSSDPVPGLLEVGMVAFNRHFQPLGGFSSPVITPEAVHHLNVGLHQGAYTMHTTRRGDGQSLLEVIENLDSVTHSPERIEQLAMDYIDGNNLGGLPMLGSSITFDRMMLRDQMPGLLSRFHYRSVDATSFYLVATRTLSLGHRLQRAGGSNHRVISDVLDSADLVSRAVSVIQGH